MKTKMMLAALSAAVSVMFVAACSQAAAAGDPVDPGDPTPDGAVFDDYAPNLFADDTITYGRWEQITGGLQPDFAIGDWDATASLEVCESGGIKAIAAVGKGWSAGTLAQLTDSVVSGSYIDFTDVAKIRFTVRSDNCTMSELKYKLVSLTGDAIAEAPLSSFTVSAADAEGWQTVTVPTTSLSAANRQIKVAFTFVLPCVEGRWAEYKDIAFLDASDANVTTLFDHVAY